MTNPSTSATPIPLKREIDYSLEQLRQLYGDMAKTLPALKSQIVKSFADATTDEMGYHEAYMRQCLDLFEELSKLLKHVKDLNAKRAAYVMLSAKGEQNEDTFVTAGCRFRVDLDLFPSLPKEPELLQQTLEWLKSWEMGAEHVYETIDWEPLKELGNHLASQGHPGVPNVKLYPKARIIMTKLT